MLAFLEQHPRFIPGLLFAASLAAQAALVFLLQGRGFRFPLLGKAPAIAVPPEKSIALVGAIVVTALTLGGFWFDLVALVGVVLVLASEGVPPPRHFGFGPGAPVPPLRALGFGLVIALAVFLPLQAFATGIEAVFRHFGLPTPPEPAVALFLKARHFGALAQLLFAALLLAPLCEEAFFRGFLHPVLKAAFPVRPGIALAATAAAFAGIHCHWATLLPLFGFGLVQGIVYETSGSLLLCLSVHFWFNTISAAALLAEIGKATP
ncbi:CAAX protease self-immunity [Verrucomicrobium sp. GAS474]|uniref:CPBP family intramembrane glutamic endopeptidase n=1 Tax=Verrucomicrobium sp. GAS474 TaxID=1882831 RepID=UPI00087DAB36|nr:CPBP family intramembrane glutamic endopeptidase [Verrucomicrobium sp. GAS474]SDU02145.1 CAAX protease self-immunity [Verrucomicrobium sp. GAS474]